MIQRLCVLANRISRRAIAAALMSAPLAAAIACSSTPPKPQYRTFATAEDAAKALTDAVKGGKVDDVIAIFGPEGRDLVDTSDPNASKQNREVFLAASAQGQRLEDDGPDAKTLLVGNEDWPFPVPIVKDDQGWHFDAEAGKDEVLSRRVGRNELAVIRVCGTYVDAQRLYAKQPHDGKPAGLYAKTFSSDPGKQNGLYWPSKHGERPSPLGDLLAEAAERDQASGQGGKPAPFHGYYFRILTGQGAAATGGAASYVVNGEMSGGFALIAWPSEYGKTGVMTFIVNQDGVVRQKDLGPDSQKAAAAITVFDPDGSWGKTS